MQTIFQRLHLSLSDYIGDTVTAYSLDGKTVKATKREQALNGAIGSIYEAYLNSYLKTDRGYINFFNDFPIYRDNKIYSFIGATPDSRAITKPTDPSLNDVRKYIRATLKISDPVTITRGVADPLTEEQYQDILDNSYSNFKPTLQHPKIYETSSYVQVLFDTVPTAIITGSVDFTVLLQPVYVAISSDPTAADVVIPPQWESEIVSLAGQILMNQRNA